MVANKHQQVQVSSNDYNILFLYFQTYSLNIHNDPG